MEKRKDFLEPKLEGERFATHTLPLGLLEDFSAFEELLFALAKQIYLDENKNRKRVPKGFGDNVRLGVSDIEKGSTMPKIVLISYIAAAPMMDVDAKNVSYIEKAKDKIIDIIDRANNERKIDLDQKFLSYFNKIGKIY